MIIGRLLRGCCNEAQSLDDSCAHGMILILRHRRCVLDEVDDLVFAGCIARIRTVAEIDNLRSRAIANVRTCAGCGREIDDHFVLAA